LACEGLIFLIVILVSPEYLVDGAVRERHHEQIAIGSCLDICANPEISPEQQTFAFGYVEFANVVGDSVLQPRIPHADILAVARQIEMEQVAAFEEGASNLEES
jgi:hypothetical protein